MILGLTLVQAQLPKYYTKTGTITFSSKAPMENIEATNRSTTCVIEASTGKIEFSVLIKGFEFEKSLMQDHFNENYLESSTYPKSTFKGAISNPNAVNWKKDGTYNVTVAGSLTIKGKAQQVSAPGTITIQAGKVNATSTFKVALADYGIAIPAAVKDKLSEKVEIKVNCNLVPM